MAKNNKRKASAPPQGFNARKKMNKRRKLTDKEKRLIYIGIGVIVIAAILFAIFYDDGSLPMKKSEVVTEGAGQLLGRAYDETTGTHAEEESESDVAVRNTDWLVVNLGTTNHPKYYKFGEVELPEGYFRSQQTNKKRQETDFWFYPEDPEDPISYIYVCGNDGDYKEMPAKTASYLPANTGVQEIGEVKNATLGGYDAYYYSYTASNQYDDSDVVEYTQSLNCYLPAGRNRMVVILVSIDADSEEDFITEEELLARAEEVASCLYIGERAEER